MPRPFCILFCTLLCSHLAATDVTPTTHLRFNSLFHAFDTANRKVSVKKTASWGYGVYAEQDIKRHEVILRIPAKFVVTHKRIIEASDDPRENTLYKDLSANDALIAWLLVNKHRTSLGQTEGMHEFTRIWLTMLPQNFSTSLQFDPSVVSTIEPQNTKQAVLRMKEEAVQKYADLKGRLWFTITLSEWKWAKSILSTRAWNMKGEESLVPVAGMFNHMPDAEDERYDPAHPSNTRSQKFLKYHASGPGYAEVRSDRDVQAGEELFESYGDNPNQIYLVYHGFFPEKNLYDCVSFALKDPFFLPDFFWKKLKVSKPMAKLSDSKVTFFKKSSIPQELCLHEGEVCKKCLLFYAVALMTDEQWKECKVSQSLKKLAKCAGLSSATIIRFFARILKHELRQKFSTSIDHDTEKIAVLEGKKTSDSDSYESEGAELQRETEDGTTSPETLTVLKYRLNQKRLLLSAAEAVMESAPKKGKGKKGETEKKGKEEEEVPTPEKESKKKENKTKKTKVQKKKKKKKKKKAKRRSYDDDDEDYWRDDDMELTADL